jgi:Ca-activated chloride channel family protein
VKRRAGLVAVVLLVGGWDALRAPDPDVDEGNQAFRKGHYDQALEHYRSAESRGVDPRLHFDMGAALYKLGEQAKDDEQKAKLLAQAEEQFRRAADTDDQVLKSSAYYNLGNAMYQRQQWEDAISAYKRALRASPTNESARHNLEMALRQRQKQDKQQQQGQGQQDQQQQGHQDQQQRQQQGQQQGQQGQQQGDQDQQGQQQDQDQDRAQQGGQGQQPDQPDQQQGQQKRPEDQQGDQDRQRQEQERQQQGQQPDQAEQPPEAEAGDSDRPTDQERKLDELERRSRDLRKRLLRQGGKSRDPMRLPSRKDW